MIDREKKYSEELANCRKSIKRTKELIQYHKGMLKSLETKEKVLSAKLEKEKISLFYKLLSEKGYDIDALKSAVESGEFDKIIMERSENIVQEETPAIEKNVNEKESITNENEGNALRTD